MATDEAHNYYAVAPPENFNFRQPDSWSKWKTRFDRYLSVSGLASRDEPSQINALLYTMGEGAEDIYASLKLTDQDSKSYAVISRRFDSYFLPKKNVIYERAKFNRRVQLPHENVDTFATDLHKLSETCEFGFLRDDLVRDRIVVGILDAKLSITLQLDSALTLETALAKARSHEIVKKQQSSLRSQDVPVRTTSDNVDILPSRRDHRQKPPPNPKTRPSTTQSYVPRTLSTCHWCGSSESHTKKTCPAHDQTCSKCGKTGHYARVCLSGRSRPMGPTHVTRSLAAPRSTPTQRPHPTHLEEVYIGTVSAESHVPPWTVDLLLNDRNVKFKIDTGADVTVVTVEVYNDALKPLTLSPPDKVLLTPAQHPLKTRGYLDTLLSDGNRSSLQRIYIVDGLQQNLLGRPAIRALQALAHIQECTTPTMDPFSLFPRLFSGLGSMRSEFAYEIKLSSDAIPFTATSPRRIPIPLFPSVKTELQRMENLGVIAKVQEATLWCSPMVIARKKGGELRICCSFEELNKYVIRERTQMPTVEESLAQLANAKVYSKIDARWGFWQVPLAEQSQKLTTFITPFGRYLYKRLPFGISSAPEHFQRVMSQILDGIPGQVCQLDDILVHGRDQLEHDNNLQAVLKRLDGSGITLNTEKCEFSKRTVTFLGHLLTPNGVAADPRKTSAIRDMAPPKDVSGVRAFLGMANHLAKFLPDLSQETKPLRDLLRTDTLWTWGPAQQSAFTLIQKRLLQPPVLTLYDPTKPLTVSADASSYGLGAVLLQEAPDGIRRPVAYASRSLTDTEQRYAQVEKEALASVWACARFRPYLVGLQFTIETDHKPLVSILMLKRLDELTPRLQRLRMKLMEYTYTVVYVPGKLLHTADALSRSPIPGSDEPDTAVAEYEALFIDLLPCSDLRLSEIASQQTSDPVISQARAYSESVWPPISSLPPELKAYAEVSHELSVINGVLLKGPRLVIPPPMREEMLCHLHAAHDGTTRTRARALLSVWWPGISAHVADFVRACPVCSKHRRNPVEPLMSTPLPERPWQMVGVDLFETGRHLHYLVVVDYFSRFFELEKLSSTTSTSVIDKMKFIFARHGIPECIRSDNGPQFASADFAAFCKEYAIKHATSSPHYPQSNGQAERSVQVAKNILLKSKPADGLLAHRSTPTPMGPSPAQLLFGRQIRSTVPALPSALEPRWPNLKEFRKADSSLKSKQSSNYNARHRAAQQAPLRSGADVWVDGHPGTVLHPEAYPRSYCIQTQSGRRLRRTRFHLRPRVPQRSPSETPSAQDFPDAPHATRSGKVYG